MDKAEIVKVLDEIGELLELQGENPFKIRAYQSGARALEGLTEDLGTLIEEQRLHEVKGIGKALAEKIRTLHTEGQLAYHRTLLADTPPGLRDMLEIPGLGPKKIRKLQQELGIESIAALKQACEADQVSTLAGFGTRSQDKILGGIRNREAYGKRHLWWPAFKTAETILDGLRKQPGVLRAEHAGSLRRRRETVGDLDFIVASADPVPVMEWFTTLKDVEEVSAKGDTKSSIRLGGGLQADLRVVPPDRFAFALHHFTGSKEHNVHMRQRALERGLSLSEWGLGSKDAEGKLDRARSLSADSEEALFKLLGLAFIPPELREDMGEIEAAENDAIPQLVTFECLKGVFHNHTHASDGADSLLEMARAAETFGWEYLGIADHSKASVQARGLDEEQLAEQIEAIRVLNQSGTLKCRLLAGSEVDILKDGSLDFSDDVLKTLDYVVASVHNAMGQDEATMTRRIIKALENEHVTILGHPTGRLLLRREPYAVDMQTVIDAALANGKVIEINAHPMRLDMDWRFWRKAGERGLQAAINPDAHQTGDLAYARCGVNIARKGWLGPQQVVNTLSWEELARLWQLDGR